MLMDASVRSCCDGAGIGNHPRPGPGWAPDGAFAGSARSSARARTSSSPSVATSRPERRAHGRGCRRRPGRRARSRPERGAVRLRGAGDREWLRCDPVRHRVGVDAERSDGTRVPVAPRATCSTAAFGAVVLGGLLPRRAVGLWPGDVDRVAARGRARRPRAARDAHRAELGSGRASRLAVPATPPARRGRRGRGARRHPQGRARADRGRRRVRDDRAHRVRRHRRLVARPRNA